MKKNIERTGTPAVAVQRFVSLHLFHVCGLNMSLNRNMEMAKSCHRFRKSSITPEIAAIVPTIRIAISMP